MKGRAVTMRYAVILEQREGGWGAYVPEFPGCIATGPTAAEAATRVRGAIEMHLEGMAEDGEAFPSPTTAVEYVEVATPASA